MARLLRKKTIQKKRWNFIQNINIDVAISNNENYTEWYYDLWKERIIDRQALLKIDKSFESVPKRARRQPEDHFDILKAQLNALVSIGFSAVECHYKCGVFAIYGGKK